jgi:hypothetical protein
MVQALGYSLDAFDPTDPGRLCRGREQWVESYESDVTEPIPRMVVSGSEFSDETARDARRGLGFSGVSIGEAFRAIFPNEPVFAAAEDGHPREVPRDAIQQEDHEVAEPAGPLRSWRVRWVLPCSVPQTIDEAVAAGADVLLVMKEPPSRGELDEELRKALFLLHGFRSEGPPERRFQAVALRAVLERVRAVGLVHLDKHGPSLGIYGPIPEGAVGALERVAAARGALPVPFAIPPMLARWDRALFELRLDWDELRRGTFPVPPANDGVETWGRVVQAEE